MAGIRSRVTQLPDLCVLVDRHRGIITVMNDEYLEWESTGCITLFCV